jgi:ubiquinone/menaquinone biosynthesis C-methylase UbiE
MSRSSFTGPVALGCAGLAAGIAVWWGRGRLADRLTTRLFRQPGGRVARSFYRDAKPHQASFRQTLGALTLGPEDHLLELGCGGGTFLEWSLASGCTAKAIDHSPEMLVLASRRNAEAIAAGRLELREADAARLPFASGEFTAAATMNAFFFFPDPEATLAEVYRTLAPAGRLAIHTSAFAPPLIADHMRVYTDDELTRELEHAGFEQITVRRTGPGGREQLVTARKP